MYTLVAKNWNECRDLERESVTCASDILTVFVHSHFSAHDIKAKGKLETRVDFEDVVYVFTDY